jgi:hypothetical protein
MVSTRNAPLIALLIVLVGCGSQTALRRQEAEARAARLGHPEMKYVESVSPGAAFALGFLPFGAAGFYVGDSKLAATGFLWPFSVLWMPTKASNKAVEVNDRDFESRMMRALESPSAS